MHNLAWSFFERTRAFHAAHRLTRHRLIAITYHHVLPDASRTPGPRPKNVTYVSEFARQIAYLVQHYHIVRQSDLERFLDGRPPAPHSLLITFDDGYRNNYTHAFPILQRFGAAATFFLSSGFVGDRHNRLWFDRLDAALAAEPDKAAAWLRAARPAGPSSLADLRNAVKHLAGPKRDAIVGDVEDATGHRHAAWFEPDRVEPMTWSEARTMARAGMQIGAHTETHQILAAAADEEAVEEVRRSRAAIESELARECWAFSYPNGEHSDFSEREFGALARAGFRCAFTQVPGTSTPSSFPFSLPRIPLPSADEFRVFQSRVTGLHQFLTNPLLAFS